MGKQLQALDLGSVRVVSQSSLIVVLLGLAQDKLTTVSLKCQVVSVRWSGLLIASAALSYLQRVDSTGLASLKPASRPRHPTRIADRARPCMGRTQRPTLSAEVAHNVVRHSNLRTRAPTSDLGQSRPESHVYQNNGPRCSLPPGRGGLSASQARAFACHSRLFERPPCRIVE